MNLLNITRKIICRESVILFCVLFLPGFIMQTGEVDGEMFNSLTFHIFFFFQAVPHIALILFVPGIIGHLNKKLNLSAPVIKKVSEIKLSDAALLMISIFSVVFLYSWILGTTGFLNEETEKFFAWKFTNYSLLPLVLLTNILTGYREELFFRSYLFDRLDKLSVPPISALLFTSLLFSAGHFYQGIAGGILTFLLGLLLGAFYLKTKNVHTVALCHGLYNTLILMLSSLA